MKLFCIPGGAASAAVYLRWTKFLDKNIKLCLLEIAGRGMRYKEECLQSMGAVADDLFKHFQEQLLKDDRDSYMLLGYCFGSIAAYEVYRRIVENGLRKPLHVFYSASDPPNGNTYATSLFSDPLRRSEIEQVLSRYFPPHVFTDADEVRFVCERITDISYENYAKYGKVIPIRSEDVFRNDGENDSGRFEKEKALEFANQTLSLFDIDQKVVQQYQTTPHDFIKVDAGVTVFAGKDDTMTRIDAVRGWEEFAANDFSLEVIDGGHLILIDGYEQCVRIINETAKRYQ